ncbi:MAG: acyl-CoA synthetase [Paracoccaceae bacterium]|nr:acyl-CoA synthetase [Paracoccaceae bacterium]
MGFATIGDIQEIEQEGAWNQLDQPKTLYDMLTNTVINRPDANAVSFQILSGPNDKAETLIWSDLHQQVTKAANLFSKLGIGESDVVAFILPNSLETVVTLLGGAVAGIVSPINPLLASDQMGALLRETGASVVVTLKPFPKTDVAQKAAEAVRLAPAVTTVLEVDLVHYLSPPKSWIVPLIRPKNPAQHHANVLDFTTELACQNSTLDFSPSTGDRVAAYFHTGGTTGMPKVAQLRYSGLIYNGWLVGRFVFDESDNVICPLPLFHVLAAVPVLMGTIFSGGHMVLPTPQGYRGEGVFDNFWKLIERWNISLIISVPTAIAALMQRPVNADISTVKKSIVGSAPLPRDLFKRFQDATGVNILEGYGMTEAACMLSVNPPDGEKKIGSVGLATPHTDIKIVKKTPDGFAECDTDEIGEICASNPGVWAGNTYTDATKNQDLYYQGTHLRTGDLGRIDSDKYVWITGRAKDLIIRGGHNIDPGQIEEALLGHPDVAFAGAIGQPCPHSGELPCAYVELVVGATVTGSELTAFCHEKITERAAQPKYIEVLETLPKTAVGKVFKPDLRKSAIMRVYNEALEDTGSQARVEIVIDDKARGLVALVNRTCEADEVQAVLGAYERPWEWSE